MIERREVQGEDYVTSIHQAVECGDILALKRLIESGESINRKSRSSETPLLRALNINNRVDRFEIIKELLNQNNIDVNLTDYWGNTALDLITAKPRTEKNQIIIDMIIDKGGIGHSFSAKYFNQHSRDIANSRCSVQ